MENKKENYKTNISTEELIALSDEFDNYDIVEHLAGSEPAEFEVHRFNFRLPTGTSLAAQSPGYLIPQFPNLAKPEPKIKKSSPSRPVGKIPQK